MNKKEIFQFKITLNHSDPPIWRRFQVPNDITFDDMHLVIQNVMGWGNDHLYEFSYQEKRLQQSEFIRESPFGFNRREPAKPAEDTFLYDWFNRVGKKIEYWYDFGDDWRHELWFEKRLPYGESRILPICLEGEMACPPEDCGGIWNFYRCIEEAKSKPGVRVDVPDDDEDEYEEGFSRFFRHYDPTRFNLDFVNDWLAETKFGKNDPMNDLKNDVLEELVVEPEPEPVPVEVEIPEEDFDESLLMEELVDEMVCMTEPTPVEAIFQEYEIEDNKQNRENFTSLVGGGNSVIWDEEKDKLYPVGYLLKHFNLRIEPTAMEIEKGILILGNRFFPFDDGYLEIESIELLYHNREMEIKTMDFLWKELEGYYPLSDMDARPRGNEGEEPPLAPDQEVTLDVWDLKDYYQKTHFRPGGSIILKPEDFFPYIFSMKYISSKKMKKQEAAMLASDQELEESLCKLLEQEHSLPGVAKQLLFAIYRMGVKPDRVAGSPLDALIKKSKNIHCVTLPENGDTVLQLKE